MYADYHPNLRQFWVLTQADQYQPLDSKNCDSLASYSLKQAAKTCATLGSSTCLVAAAPCLAGEFESVELWAPRFDLSSAVLSRERLSRAERPVPAPEQAEP
jgi:hypothetical protein